MESRYTLWGSRLSPFALKLAAMLDRGGIDYRTCPADGGRVENLGLARRLGKLRAGRLTIDYPEMSDLDELPSVPFLLGERGENLYDSSALAAWIDERRPGRPQLVPAAGAARFAAKLIDEYFDEFGLYMAHHHRWVTSAHTNDAGDRLARDFRFLFPGPTRPLASRWFAARQVRRLPYLFSVAPDDDRYSDLPARIRPPGRDGFPPTHDLLERAFVRMLERMELVLSDRPYMLGDRFTVADASAYGELCMNTHDPSASEIIEMRAPLTYAWVKRIESGRFEEAAIDDADLDVGGRLTPLLEEVGRVFVPLMRQNEAAYERELDQGAAPAGRHYNETGFDAGTALYDGELDGAPFRAVVKTFQVAVWQRLLAEWRSLDRAERARLPLSLD